MNRRQFISGSAAVSLAVAAAVAQAHPGHDHGAHDHQHGAAANPYEAARKAAGHCVSAGQACLAHCIDLLSRGDTSMKDCAAAANQMLALCGALQNLAAQRSPLTPALAKVCAEACKPPRRVQSLLRVLHQLRPRVRENRRLSASYVPTPVILSSRAFFISMGFQAAFGLRLIISRLPLIWRGLV